MNTQIAKLVIGDQTHEFPVLSGSVAPDVIDTRSLYAKTGMFTYDPGFTSTAACDSAHHLYRRRQGPVAIFCLDQPGVLRRRSAHLVSYIPT